MLQETTLIKNDIVSYLKSHEYKSLLRFITCGSVDDGKSTLIGRLLYESKLIYEDQLNALKKDLLNKKKLLPKRLLKKVREWLFLLINGI